MDTRRRGHGMPKAMGFTTATFMCRLCIILACPYALLATYPIVMNSMNLMRPVETSAFMIMFYFAAFIQHRF